MSSLQVLMPVLLTIPGHPSIIFTWVITHTPGMGFVMVMVGTVDTLSGLAMATHRGITPTVTMDTTHHGTTPIIATPTIPVGNLIMVTARVIMVVVTGITTATVTMIDMREMTAMTDVGGTERVRMRTIPPPIARTGTMLQAITAHHPSTVMFLPRLPDIPETGAW